MEAIALIGLLLVILLLIPNKPLLPSLYRFRQLKASYLESQLWKDKRKSVLKRDSYMCTNCGTVHNLHVHHDSGYALIPNEPIECLRTLCDSCHKSLHKSLGYPRTLNDYKNWNSHGFKPSIN